MFGYNSIVVQKISKGLLKSYQYWWPRDLISVILCSSIDFHAQTMNWDCGYRNIQSMLTSFLNFDCFARDHLFSSGFSLVPRILDIQNKIEKAWKKGYDQIGGSQLEYILFKTNKWIGATEVVTMMRFCGLKGCVADFDFTAKKMDLNTMVLLFWEYFVSRSKIPKATGRYINYPIVTFIPPLYFQHQGHSRLIFGAERWVDGEIKLLILDPQLRRIYQFYHRPGRQHNNLRYECDSYEINAISKYQIAYLHKYYHFVESDNDTKKTIGDELKPQKTKKNGEDVKFPIN